MFTQEPSFKQSLCTSALLTIAACILLTLTGALGVEYWLFGNIPNITKISVYSTLYIVLLMLFLPITAYNIRQNIKRLQTPLLDIQQTTLNLMDNSLSEQRVTSCNKLEVKPLIQSFNQMLDVFAHEKLSQQASENRFRTLTAHAPIGIFQLDNRNNLVYANDHWYRITETHSEDNAWAAHQQKISEKDRERYHSNWNHSVQKNKPVILEYQYQTNSQGNPLYLMENISPLQSGNGMNGIIGTLTDVTELKNAQFKLEKLSFYDLLTGLPNRRFFTDLLSFGLAKAKRSNSKAAVLMLDLDNFKRVNDLLGHGGGDELLQQQAQRIRDAVREENVVSRMGGDEFAIMLSPVHEISEITTLTKRVMDALNTPIIIGNHTLELGASIGIALYPNDGEALDELIRNADMALYEAKDNGRNRVNFFSYKLDLQLRESVRIEQKLKYVIQRQGLQTFLQPQVSGTGEVLWAEALIRWIDEEEGPISPKQFIPLAEETGLIHDIGLWMLDQICLNLSQNKAYLNAVGIKGISVNLSGHQFYSRSLLEDIQSTIEKYGVNPELIEFELTESAVMDDVAVAIDVMKGIQDMGCKIAIDDFGTGYSSLSYLQRLPINSLKIDRSFVLDIPFDTHGSAIATAIIAMAHKLGLSVVAEGVETKEQQSFLVNQGCELLQGYLFFKPEKIDIHVKRGREALFNEDGRIVRP